MRLYAITNRALLAESEAERAEKLIALVEEWSARGVDFVQIREKDLPPEQLAELAAKIVRAVRRGGNLTKVLVNASPETAAEIARESGADGIHLPGGLSPGQLDAAISSMRDTWPIHRNPSYGPTVGVSCHAVEEVKDARAAGASLALFSPVFEKLIPGGPPLAGRGIELLADACRAAKEDGAQSEIPVFALGGISRENASLCVAAGAAGIAAIRLFMRKLREGPEWIDLLPSAEGAIAGLHLPDQRRP